MSNSDQEKQALIARVEALEAALIESRDDFIVLGRAGEYIAKIDQALSNTNPDIYLARQAVVELEEDEFIIGEIALIAREPTGDSRWHAGERVMVMDKCMMTTVSGKEKMGYMIQSGVKIASCVAEDLQKLEDEQEQE